MSSRNRHLSLEQPFEEVSQCRPRRAPMEHNVRKTHSAGEPSENTLAGPATHTQRTYTPVSWPMGVDRLTTPFAPDGAPGDTTPGSTNTSTSIRVLEVRRAADPTAATCCSLDTTHDLYASTSQLSSQAVPPPRYGRRGVEHHHDNPVGNWQTGDEEEGRRVPQQFKSSLGPRLHLDFNDAPRHPGVATHAAATERPQPPAAATTTTSQSDKHLTTRESSLGSLVRPPYERDGAPASRDPHEAAVAVLRLRERPTRATTRGSDGRPGAPSCRASSKTGLPPRHLPPAHEKAWLNALDAIITRVWATLGFLALPPLPSSRASDDTSTAPHITIEDQALFVSQLRYYFASGGRGLERVACTSATLGNALWYVLFNAVYYCVGVLGSAYVPVRGSADSSADGDGEYGEPPAAVPTALRWPTRGAETGSSAIPNPDDVTASLGDRLTALAQQFRPTPEPPRRRGDQSKHADTELSFLSEAGPSVWATDACENVEVDPAQYANAFSQAPSFPAGDWFFVVRYMSCIGYRRDAFYLQTPANACPQELMLALLWLTKKYLLLAVAEYVELNLRFPFLLVHHADPVTTQRGEEEESVAPVAGPERRTAERLLFAFPKASAWPPVSFDEAQSLDRRLLLLQRLLGGSSEDAANVAKDGPSTQLRRLLAVRRQLDLSLTRAEKALHQRTDQIRFLGLHNPLDAQLCLPEHDALYNRLLAGLKYVRGVEERTKSRVQELAALGDLVAYALRHHRTSSTPSEAQVLDGLEEDANTWLPTAQPSEPSGGTGSGTPSRRAVTVAQSTLTALSDATGALDSDRLKATTSKFRATRTKQYLTDLWRSLTRRAQMETAPPAASRTRARSHAPERHFAADVHAQRSHQGQVRRNLVARYSLQAALAAEVLLLQESRDARPVDATAEALPLFSIDTLPLDLTCGAHERYQALLAQRHRAQTDSSAASKAPPLPTAMYQLTEVGVPAATATTSARLEFRRLTALLEQLQSESAESSPRGRRTEAAVAMLHDVYHLRVAKSVKGRGA